jgi:excisionase family DNA binding protein
MKAENNPVGDSLLTLEKVAGLLSVTKRTVYRLIAKGELAKPHKVGHSVRFFVSDISAYFEKLKGKHGGMCA